MRGAFDGTNTAMPSKKSDDFFSVWGEQKMPRTKTADQVATEKILADYQRENPSQEPPGRQIVSLETREKMRRQKAASEADLQAASGAGVGGQYRCPGCGRRWPTKLDIWGRECRGCHDDRDDGGQRARNPKPKTLA